MESLKQRKLEKEKKRDPCHVLSVVTSQLVNRKTYLDNDEQGAWLRQEESPELITSQYKKV